MTENDTRKPAHPCPFCGGGGLFHEEERGLAGPEHRLICSSCGATGPVAKTPEAATERWNERAE